MAEIGASFVLAPDNACAYAAARGWVPAGPCRAVALGGGVSNEVVLVEAGGRRVVVKQALARLRVAAQWLAEPRRSGVEAECMRLLARVLPQGAVPNLIGTDAADHVLAMTAAPPDADNLKAVLLRGRPAGVHAATAGADLGAIQAGSRGRDDVAARFADLDPFVQLRIDPYYREAARRHPGLAGALEARASEALAARECLVHGDYSPKNMLVDGDRLMLVDFEVAHWGCRAFDPAFFLNHLALKAMHMPEHAQGFADAAERFWSAFTAAAGWVDVPTLEREVVGHLGALLLARVDGKSPVEYITDEAVKERVRGLARRLLRHGGRLDAVFGGLAA